MHVNVITIRTQHSGRCCSFFCHMYDANETPRTYERERKQKTGKTNLIVFGKKIEVKL